MKLLKKLTIALLIACSFMLVVPVVSPLFSDSYTVEAASKPKLTYKITKAKQKGKYYYIEGKVYNKTKSNLSSAQIDIRLYDKNKKKIKLSSYGKKYDFYDSVMWMDAKGTWKFAERIYVGDKKVKSYKISTSGSYFYSYGYTKFKSSITSMKKTKTYKLNGTTYNVYTVKGKIKNKTGKKMNDVFVTYAFYDKNGRLLSTRFCGYYKGYKNNKEFKVTETSHSMDSSLKPVKCKIVEVHGYNL